VWCRLGEISAIVTDGEHLTPKRCKEYCGYYLLSARNIIDGKISLVDVDYVDEVEYTRISRRCNPQRNDILISCSGSVGRVAVVNDNNHYVMVRSAAMASTLLNLIVVYDWV
jgi:type I restriction enzyme S subunit